MSPKPSHKKNINRKFSNKQFEEILLYFSSSILNKETEEEILWDLAQNCISKLGFVDCVVYLVDKQKDRLIQKAAFGQKNPRNHEIYNPVEIPLGKGITGTVALTGRAEIIENTQNDPRYIVDDAQRLSEITIPIVHNNTVIGIIDCEHPKQGFFTSQHLRILSAIANICAIRIANLRADNKLENEQEKRYILYKQLIDLKIKTLNSQMNPHFVFNALNAIQFFITNGDKRLALRYLSIFSKLIRFFLKSFDKETVNLKEEITMLNNYLTLQKLRYNDQFDYNISIDDHSITTEAVIPQLLLQTLFENAIESSIFNQYKKHKINTVFKVKKDKVIVNISFSYSFNIEHNFRNVPEYRERMIKWQDQIRLLNQLKNYNIKKNVIFTKDDKDQTVLSHIKLLLPNLI